MPMASLCSFVRPMVPLQPRRQSDLCSHHHVAFSLPLALLSPSYKDSYDYIEHIQITQDNISIARSLT